MPPTRHWKIWKKHVFRWGVRSSSSGTATRLVLTRLRWSKSGRRFWITWEIPISMESEAFLEVTCMICSRETSWRKLVYLRSWSKLETWISITSLRFATAASRGSLGLREYQTWITLLSESSSSTTRSEAWLHSARIVSTFMIPAPSCRTSSSQSGTSPNAASTATWTPWRTWQWWCKVSVSSPQSLRVMAKSQLKSKLEKARYTKCKPSPGSTKGWLLRLRSRRLHKWPRWKPLFDKVNKILN